MLVETPVETRPTLTRRRLRREVWRLAWPVIVQNFFQTLILTTDALFVGWLGTSSLAAMGVAWPIFWSSSAILFAIQVGALALVARAVGEGDPEKSRESAATALVAGLFLGLPLAAACSLGAEPLARLFSADPELVHRASLFLAVASLSLPFSILTHVGTAVLRGSGNTSTPMWVAGGVNLINIALNYLLIFGRYGFPELGITGAGVATLSARMVEGLVLAGWLCRRDAVIRLTLADLGRISRASLARFLRVTVPAMVEPLVLHSGFLVFSGLISSLGAASMAAHRVAVSIESFTFMPGFAFGIASATLVGQALGARRPRQAEVSCQEALRMAMLLMVGVGLAYLVAPVALARCFTTDPDVLPKVVTCLLLAGLEQPFMAVGLTLQGALRGAGDTRSTVYVAAVGVWAVRVPFVWLAVRHGFGLGGVWAVALVDWSIRAGIYWWLYRRGRWKAVAL
ncbi:MAG: MATE family efflux transporter [Planctomycetes bacterium]|nr:MATE family efflux transporter [Planctomycetota bacterium]